MSLRIVRKPKPEPEPPVEPPVETYGIPMLIVLDPHPSVQLRRTA